MVDLRKGYDNAFFVDAILDGNKQKTLDALIDTGASTTHINNETCIENKLKPLGSRGGSICIHGEAHKDLRVPMYEATITVAGIKAEKLRISGLSKDVTLNKKKIEVVIGRDILKNFIMTLDWKKCKGELNPET